MNPLISCAAFALFAASAYSFPGEATEAAPQDQVRYSRDIRSILSDRCFECHGTDPETRAAGLRLDSFEEATADLGGYAAIVPGDVEASELWQRITSEDVHDIMPPPEAKKQALSRE